PQPEDAEERTDEDDGRAKRDERRKGAAEPAHQWWNDEPAADREDEDRRCGDQRRARLPSVAHDPFSRSPSLISARRRFCRPPASKFPGASHASSAARLS